MINTKSTIYTQTLYIGEGVIEPAVHIAQGKYSEDLVNQAEIAAASDQKLYETIELNIPQQCADGRTVWVIGGSAIGGSFTSVIADALTLRRYLEPQMSAKDHAARVYQQFRRQGLVVGGHCDDSSSMPNCGCGGLDRLISNDPDRLSILGFISQQSPIIRTFLENLRDSLSGENLNVEIDDDAHNLIAGNARELMRRNNNDFMYASSGTQLCAVLEQNNGEIETLHGKHKEALVVLDLRNNIALNRARFCELFDGMVQAFYVNLACIKNAANLLYETDEERALAFVGALYYNVAATAVLAGPSLRVVALN